MKTILKIAMLIAIVVLFGCQNESLIDANSENQVASKSNNGKSANALNSVLKEFIKGSPLHGANGIDIGADGHLYVSSVLGGEIAVIDKQNGKIIKRFGASSGVLSPDDLVIGPDGTIYWTDIFTGFVGRMSADGQQLGYQYVADGVNPITFSPDGRLFVGLDFLGDGLYELDPNLVDPPRPIIVATTENPFPLGFLNAFDFGADGRLYGPLFAAGLVVSVDVDPNNPVSTDPFVDGIVQVVAAGLVNPASTKFDPDGLLTVLDQTGEVFKIDTTSGEKTLFTTLQPGLDNMVFDSDGTLYMTNNDEGWVAEILKSGQSRIISIGGMIVPGGLAVLPGSNNQDMVFEADIYRLRQFNGSSGQQENSYKGYLIPEGPQSLILPMNLSVDGENLVMTSWFDGGVQVWNSQTNQVLEQYLFPAPIDAVRFKDDLVVADAGLGGLFWASDQSQIESLPAPSGLATDGETVWVADWATGIVWQIDFDGKTPQTPINVASGLANPEGLALDNEGRLLVVESGVGRLSRIDLNTREMITIAEGFEFSTPGLGVPPTWYFDGVAVGPSGDIYVSGGGKNVIYRVSQN